ncbi:hypothetical protein HBH53_024070 [Parastagonospora nodorum]|nr:hypothetical protein HBH53_024070 [Parastagonospora nodorum]
MIYEQLPTKVTHRHIPNQAPIVVHITLPGVKLLATYRQIRSEATAILSKKLTAIASQPVRIIAPNLHDNNLRALFLVVANKKSTHESPSPLQLDFSNAKTQHICIAMLDNTPRTVYQEARNTLSKFAGFWMISGQVYSRILGDLDVQVRPTLMSEDKKRAYYGLPPGAIESVTWQ